MSGGGGGGGNGLLNMGLMIAAGVAAPELAPILMEGGGAGLALGETAATAVTGAGLGGLAGAATGQNVLRSALMGGVGGALSGSLAADPAISGGGVGGALDTSGQTLGTQALTEAGAPVTGGTLGTVTTPTDVSQAVSNGQMTMDQANAYGKAYSSAFQNPQIINPGIGNATNAQMIAGGATGLMGYQSKRPGAYTPPNAIDTGGNLSKFKYDPNNYTPDTVVPPKPPYATNYSGMAAAKGGIMSLASGGPIPQSMVDQAAQQMLAQNQKNAPSSNLVASNNSNQFANPISAPAGYTMNSYDEYVPNQMPDTTNFLNIPNEELMRILSHNSMASGGITYMAGGGTGKDALKDLLSSRDAMDQYESQYQSDPTAVAGKAQGGDYNAMLALNKLRGTPNANYAGGGIANLGSYSDGGRLLKGPGDGMSDDIPATIGGRQEARLADGEFVVPADVVSGLGNGSTDAGAKHLYKMMDKVRHARTGRKSQAKQIKGEKFVPA